MNIGPMHHHERPSLTPKQAESMEIADQVERFLASGGQIRRPAGEVPTKPWTRPEDVARKTLISLTRFARDCDVASSVVISVIRDGRLTAYDRLGDIYLVRSHATAWHRQYLKDGRAAA